MKFLKKLVKSKSLILCLGAFLAVYTVAHFKLVVVNITPSIQTGVYIRTFKKPQKNDIVSIKVPIGAGLRNKEMLEKQWVVKNGFINKLKPISALKGDTIHIKADKIYVNDEYYGQIFNIKKDGKIIDYVSLANKKYNGYTLKDNEFMGLSKRTGSNDGRYEDGILNLNQISGTYKLLIPFTADTGYCFEDLKNNSKKCQNVRKYKKSPLTEKENKYYETETKNE